MAERLRKDKAKYKGAYTRTKTKLMMTLEGGAGPVLLLLLWLFNSRFLSVLYAKGRLQVVFTITTRDIYIPVVVEEVIKFESAPLIRPNFFGPLVTVLTGFHCTENYSS